MSGETVRVRFVTKYPQYAAAQGDFDISATLNRQGLSAALNQLFEEEEQIPFDFKINGSFLRQTLAQALKQHHISTESLVTVEFFPAFQPPEEIESQSTEAWISCIRLVGADVLFSAYDGTVHLGAKSWRAANPLKCVAPIGSAGLIAGDLDGNVVLFDKASENTSTFSLHNGPVQCIETRPELEHLFITAGSDSNIQMWSTGGEGNLMSGFFGHTDSVQSLRWIDQETLLSSSLDRTIRVWDVNTQQQKSVLSAPCGVLSAAMSGNLVISGHPDRSAKLWDTRVEVRQSVVREFKSHKNWVVAVEWHDSEVFASASYDGSVKLWNVGTTVPLSTVFQHDEKVLALAVNDEMLVAGGSDQVLRKYRFKKV